MVSIEEASTGDCIYALLACQNTPVFCEITKILDGERAFEVTTLMWGQRIVTETNAYWEEKQAKRSKIVKLQNNYSEWAKEY